MADTDWMPGIAHDPGANATYAQGRCQMVNVKLHFTVGRYAGDYSIGKRGYFQFYVPRELEPVQFAEANAICWDSGSWNVDGPGIEFERLSYDEPLTDKQLVNGGAIIRWLAETYGIPLDLYDGPRVDRRTGFINHGSLLGRGGDKQDHTDGVLRAEWDAMTVTAPPVPVWKDSTMILRATSNSTINPGVTTGSCWYDSTTRFLKLDPNNLPAGAVVLDVPGDDIGTLSAEKKQLLAGGAGTAAGGPLVVTLTGTAKPG